MNFFIKLFIFYILIPLSTSFAGMVTFNQKAIVNDNSGNHGPLSSDADFGVASGIEFNADGTKSPLSVSSVLLPPLVSALASASASLPYHATNSFSPIVPLPSVSNNFIASLRSFLDAATPNSIHICLNSLRSIPFFPS